MQVNEDTDGAWVVIGREPGMRELAFQKADPWRPPRWPDPQHPQQEHLDMRRTPRATPSASSTRQRRRAASFALVLRQSGSSSRSGQL
jgi:hypothetical protein